jgi:S-formylglutathione hydrolase FrmB
MRSEISRGAKGVEFLHVMLDPSCPLGHHVFADSANNGPCGTALVEEFIPEFERTYRAVAEPSARFLTGHSSGGWSSLWLQVSHPDTFGGTWSTSPDPVDFRNFQQIDLYRSRENVYVDAKGEQRPLARMRGSVLLWYRGFDQMEQVLGPGGQLHSFEAVFSPRGSNGKPLAAWDRKTGAVDAAVARTWEKYDIRLIIERNWPTLGAKLAGKLHVYMGDADTFYLDGATRLLKESLAKLGSDAVVELFPGRDHFTLLSRELRQRIRTEMAQAFLKSHPDFGTQK